MDLDLWDCFGRKKKSVLYPRKYGIILPVCMYKSIEAQSISPTVCEILDFNTRVSARKKEVVILKAPSKFAADDIFNFFYFYLLTKIRLNVSCESSA